jgi:hypothetical protein
MITLLPYVDSLKALHPSTWLSVFLTHDAPLLLFRRFLHLRYTTHLDTWTHQEDESMDLHQLVTTHSFLNFRCLNHEPSHGPTKH